jgi:glycine/D-amino acid oxidase-like deaminating enzyme
MQAMHHSAGAPSELLDRTELARRWPSVNFEDIDGALYSAIDGRVDPNACLSGFRKGAIAAGVEYRADKVVAIEHDERSVSGVRLQSGEVVPASHAINATNCWAPEICAMVGMTIPILPLCRETFFFDCQRDIEPIPVFRDSNGFAIRPEGEGYLTGRTDPKKLGILGWEVDYSRFDEDLWPLLAHRCPAFEAVKVKSGWAGNYDICTLDGNPIIGPWVGGIENFLVAAGFSGHGLQHGPAVGRGVAELLLDGSYQKIDLGRFSYKRVLDNKPIVDLGPTA